MNPSAENKELSKTESVLLDNAINDIEFFIQVRCHSIPEPTDMVGLERMERGSVYDEIWRHVLETAGLFFRDSGNTEANLRILQGKIRDIAVMCGVDSAIDARNEGVPVEYILN